MRNMNMKVILMAIFVFLCQTGYTQFDYFRIDIFPVTIDAKEIRNPWAGGFIGCQFSAVDLNMDGVKDLFVFDRAGDKIITFINKGTPNVVDYVHAPEYQALFPKLKYWAVLVDYDCDGKEDLFTAATAMNNAMAVYKNISVTTVNFSLVEPVLYVYDTPIVTRLKVLHEDVPSFVDVDSDGDLDILTFGSGFHDNSVLFAKNMTIDKYGICDSLDFEIRNRCWGFFIESPVSYEVFLFDTCLMNVANPEKTASLHSGSTLLGLDLNGDGVKDLIMGDENYPYLNGITNGGTSTSSGMISQDTMFPSYDVSANMEEFLGAFYVDVDNDSKRDLIVSPNKLNFSNYPSVWYYKNIGIDDAPVFSFQTKGFLQNNMIEVGRNGHPVFFDADNDGLLDLLVGNYGYFSGTGYDTSGISFYRNVGDSTDPAFELITRDYQTLFSMGLNNVYPTFGDLDDDGDEDMIVGDHAGMIHYFINNAAAGNPAAFILNANPNIDSIDVGNFATPQLIDVNRDSKLDLLIGEEGGVINYYENIGTVGMPVFAMVTDSFGGVNVNNGAIYGYSTPFLFDDSGTYLLFVGSERGNIFHYNNIDGNLNGTFSIADTMLAGIWEGRYSSVYGGDINNDGYRDLIIGNETGGLAMYTIDTLLDTSISVNEVIIDPIDIKFIPNPVRTTLQIHMETGNYEPFTYAIFDILGEMRSEGALPNTMTLNVGYLANGIYFIKLTNDHHQYVKKLVIHH